MPPKSRTAPESTAIARRKAAGLKPTSHVGGNFASELSTPEGRKWAERLRLSEAYYKKNLKDSKELYKLYCSVYETRNKWGASISMAWAVVNNLVITTYLQNPEPWIQSRQQGANKDVDRMLRDLFKTIHRDNDLETQMKQGMVTSAYAYSAIWTSFEEDRMDTFQPIQDEEGPILDPETGEAPEIDGQPLAVQDEAGKPVVSSVPTRQKVTTELVTGFDLRHDPDGRKWDLSDHKWLARIYTRSLQFFIDEYEKNPESGFTADGISRLKKWVSGHRAMKRPDRPSNAYSQEQGYQEDDPAYINVSVFEVWSKAEKKIIHIPVGATFALGDAYDWPEENTESGQYPATIIGFNWQPPDEMGEMGFYPIPLLRLIRSHLENLNRLEALFMESATFAVKKYISISGILDATAKQKLQDDKNRDWIEIDVSTLKKIFPALAASPEQLDIRRLFTLLPQEDKQDTKIFLEAINHELDMIYQIIGQGSGDRGGIAQAESATATLAISQQLQQRTSEMAEQAAKIVDRVDEKIWLILKTKATLPVMYQLSTGKGSQATWGQFLAEDLWDMDLVITHHAGSTRPPNREQQKLERKEVAQLTLPVLQTLQMFRETRMMIKWMLEPYDFDLVNGLFSDEVPDLSKQVASMLLKVRSGQENPADPKFANAFMNSVANLLSSTLSPADQQQVAQEAAQAGMAPGQQGAAEGGQGSLPKAKSVGQNAHAQIAGAAASGAVGGMA